MPRHIDTGSLVVALVTLVLFVAALFAKGLTHDLFLEAGVFLVSVKIIRLSYENSQSVERLSVKLDAILAVLAANDRRTPAAPGTQSSPGRRE